MKRLYQVLLVFDIIGILLFLILYLFFNLQNLSFRQFGNQGLSVLMLVTFLGVIRLLITLFLQFSKPSSYKFPDFIFKLLYSILLYCFLFFLFFKDMFFMEYLEGKSFGFKLTSFIINILVRSFFLYIFVFFRFENFFKK